MTAGTSTRSGPAFLTARWSNLAIISYAVEASMLERFLPPDCMLDTFMAAGPER